MFGNKVNKSIISGIYKIENKVNGKKYIGSSIDIIDRWSRHKNKLNSQNHYNDHLQNAWNKYGAENFFFTILEDQVEEERLIPREDRWMTAYESLKKNKGYNLKPASRGAIMSKANKGKTPWLGKRHSKETKQKISKANKGKAPWLGKKHSEESKIKMSKMAQGRRHSEEAKRKISEAGKKRWARIKAKNI